MLVKRKKGLVVDQGTLGRTSDGWMDGQTDEWYVNVQGMVVVVGWSVSLVEHGISSLNVMRDINRDR